MADWEVHSITPADAIRDALRGWLEWAENDAESGYWPNEAAIERDYGYLTNAVLTGLRKKGFKVVRMYELVDTTR